MRQILLATQNPGKIAELRTLLANLPIEVLGLDDLGLSFPEPPETGTTFEDNAALKALTYAQWTGLPSLADDSGLEVDALAGNPGVNSAWYAYASEAEAKAHPRHIRDPANCTLLLTQLADTAEHLRTARFVCCMALASGASILTTSKGTLEGRIGSPPRVPAGANGFGYDPIFLVAPHHTHTSAELAPTDKNAISHRGNAARLMAQRIRSLLATHTPPQ